MLDQVDFSGTDREHYVLLRDPAMEDPWPTDGRFEKLEPRTAARIVFHSVYDRYGRPNWDMLRLLGICTHPRDVDPGELRALVTNLVGDHYLRRFTLYRRLDELPQRLNVAPRWRDPEPPLPPSAVLDFFGIELVDEEDQKVPAHLLEIAFADGERRMLATSQLGAILVTEIPAGTCQVLLGD